MSDSSVTSVVDERNITFWNELCGSSLARRLGVLDDSPVSLKRFDDWYFDFYDYLTAHIPFADFGDRRVLEIGLGYGSVAQRLMEAGAHYYGLDIADGPVSMARHRAKLIGATASVQQGSALAIPYPDGHFDAVVTIGCLHHTGDLASALREVHRCLRAGGAAIVMVYNALSYRQWMSAPVATLRRRQKPDFEWSNASAAFRRRYDANFEGSAAPETTFVSAAELRTFLSVLFTKVTVTPRNIGEDFPPARVMPRRVANALFESWLGLDLYVTCVK